LELPEYVGEGYAGNEEGYNNPDYQCEKNTGPLPRGKYAIGPLETHYTYSGIPLKNSMSLTPGNSNKMCNRNSFLIHSDVGSNGCIVMPDEVRLMIGHSNDKALMVYK